MNSVPPDDAWRLSLREFVSQLLDDLDPRAELVAFIDALPDNFGLQVETPDDVGKILLVSKRLVQDARVNPAALRSLRLFLQTEVLHQHVRRTVDDARERRRMLRGLTGLCDVCERPFRIYERMVVRRARIIHARCDPRERS
jgi:hypothetical protein